MLCRMAWSSFLIRTNSLYIFLNIFLTPLSHNFLVAIFHYRHLPRLFFLLLVGIVSQFLT